MQGRDYISLAGEIIRGGTERHWRGASGRAYYGLFLECRDALVRWGFVIPRRDNVHTAVRLRFSFSSDPILKSIGDVLDSYGRLRNKADYDLSTLPQFASDKLAQKSIQDCTQGVSILDTIDVDPARRATAISAIRAAFP